MNMNKIKYTGLILFLLFTILSCEKDKIELGDIKFKLDGVEHRFTGQADRSETNATNSEYVLNIWHGIGVAGPLQMSLDVWRFEEIENGVIRITYQFLSEPEGL